jgi:tetratricopeptide (TPR) repeat protein
MAETNLSDAVPGSIQSLVQARMDSLGSGERRALQAAAVLGQLFPLEALRHVLEDVGFSCEGLTEKFMLRSAGGGDWAFAHALIRDGVYNALLREEKRALHARAAAWFELRDAALYAIHLDRAEDERAADAYLAAARAEAAKHRHAAAADLATSGAALPAAAETAFELYWLAGDMLRTAGSIDAAADAFRRARDLAPDDAARCRAWLGTADCMRLSDRYEEALQALDAAQALAEAGGLTAEMSGIHYRRANICFPLGRIDDCLAEHELARRYGAEAGLPDAEARALGGLGDAYYLRGQMKTARDYFARCVALCRENGFEQIEVVNLHMLANAQAYLLETEQASRQYAETIALAERLGQQRPLVISLMGCDTKLDLGDADGALADIETALEIIARIGLHRFEPWCLIFKARILDSRGQQDEALSLAERAVEICRDTGVTFLGPMALGAYALLCRDGEKRRAAYEEAEALLGQGCVSHDYLYFYRDAMEASLAAGEWDAVERFAAALADYTRAEPLPWSDYYIAWGRALAAWGRGDRGAEAELHRLLATARKAHVGMAIPALEKALAEA